MRDESFEWAMMAFTTIDEDGDQEMSGEDQDSDPDSQLASEDEDQDSDDE